MSEKKMYIYIIIIIIFDNDVARVYTWCRLCCCDLCVRVVLFIFVYFFLVPWSSAFFLFSLFFSYNI